MRDKLQNPEACSSCLRRLLDTYDYYLQREGLAETERREHILDFLKKREMSKISCRDPSYISNMKGTLEYLKYRGLPEYFLELMTHPVFEWTIVGFHDNSSKILKLIFSNGQTVCHVLTFFIKIGMYISKAVLPFLYRWIRRWLLMNRALYIKINPKRCNLNDPVW